MVVTSVQDNVVNHIAPVFGVVEAERAAQVFREVLRCIVVVTSLHMQVKGIPERDTHRKRDHCTNKVSLVFCTCVRTPQSV